MSVETDFAGHVSTESAGPLMPLAPEAATQQEAGAPSSEACPTPLGWAEVLESFRAESTPWTVDVGGSLLQGRTLGHGQPLYFLNGISGNCELFCLLAWLLRDQYRCVLFDYRDCDSHAASGASAKSKRLTVERLGRGFAWFDAGTHDSLLEAAEFVRVLQRRQGQLVCSPDEIAFHNSWIDAAELKALAAKAGKTLYAQRLLENLR